MANLLEKRWNIYSIILIIQALYSLKVWFLWWVPEFAASIVFGIISLIYLFVSHFWNLRDTRRTFVALLIIIMFLYRTEGNINAYIFSLLQSFTLIPLVFLKTKYLADLIDRFQKVITVILAASLFFWIGHLLGIDLPSFEITYGKIDRGSGIENQYYFSNHFFYLVDQSWLFRGGIVPAFMRFYSVFLEPGYLAILMVFLLFINNFDIKDRRNILYIAVIIATVSLAGFLMGIFAYVAHSVQHSRRGIVGMVMVAILLFFSYDFFKGYNHGNNFVNQGIIERLEYDNTEGTIVGNNRTSEALDIQFEEFIGTSDVWLGKGERAELEFGVGYKAFMLKYGIFGLVLFLVYMYLIARIGRNYRANVMFVLYVLMFLRGHGPIFWHGFMLVYICGVMLSKYESLSHEKNSTHLTLQRV